MHCCAPCTRADELFSRSGGHGVSACAYSSACSLLKHITAVSSRTPCYSNVKCCVQCAYGLVHVCFQFVPCRNFSCSCPQGEFDKVGVDVPSQPARRDMGTGFFHCGSFQRPAAFFPWECFYCTPPAVTYNSTKPPAGANL